MNLSDVAHGGTICLSKAGLTVGGTSTGVAIAAPNGAGVDFAINGVLYHKADAATVAITAADEQAELTTCIYLVCLSTAGALTTVKGTEVVTADLEGESTVLEIPLPTSGTCPIGYVRVKTADGYTFTAGTTALDATGITDTYVDLMCLPTSPLTA